MNKAWNEVKLFHQKFNHPISDTPVFLESQRAKNRAIWMMEEISEFLIAKDIYEQADSIIDLIYFALGTLVEMGIEPDDLFKIIQEANMTKLWEDGLPRYNKKDGKIIKPDNWENPCPKIKSLINSLMDDIFIDNE
jgi:predicted HAD superfamily Cof-like phosphohydrolase